MSLTSVAISVTTLLPVLGPPQDVHDSIRLPGESGHKSPKGERAQETERRGFSATESAVPVQDPLP
jgi:hypothetical protein